MERFFDIFPQLAERGGIVVGPVGIDAVSKRRRHEDGPARSAKDCSRPIVVGIDVRGEFRCMLCFHLRRPKVIGRVEHEPLAVHMSELLDHRVPR